MPDCDSALSRWLCGTVSKAFFTSKKTAAICLLSERRLCHVLVTESSVEDRGLKPNWQLDRSL